MSKLEKYTFLITLSYGTDFVSKFDMTNYPIYGAKYFSVYSTFDCSIIQPFTNVGYNFDEEGNLTPSNAIDTTEGVGIFYECKTTYIQKGSISLNKQLNFVLPDSISLLFTFWQDLPPMMPTYEHCQYLTLNFGGQSSISFDLANTPITGGYKKFQLFSNIYDTFKVSFVKANTSLIPTDSGTETNKYNLYIPSNSNIIETYENVEYILKQGVITSLNPTSIESIIVILFFFN
jgi:hypothetical protein